MALAGCFRGGDGVARINVDDSLEADRRFKRLVRLVNSHREAIGMLVEFWRIAQDYWGKEMSLVPFHEFVEEGFEPILEAGLAEQRENGIFAIGSKKRFDWYLQKCRASRAGVEAKSTKRLTVKKQRSGQPEDHFASIKANAHNDSQRKNEPPVNPPTLSPTLTLSPVLVREEAPEQTKIENLVTIGVSEVVSCIHTLGRNSNAAQEKLGPLIWQVLTKRYPTNTWGNIVTLYEQAARRKASGMWEKDLEKIFRAHIWVLRSTN